MGNNRYCWRISSLSHRYLRSRNHSEHIRWQESVDFCQRPDQYFPFSWPFFSRWLRLGQEHLGFVGCWSHPPRAWNEFVRDYLVFNFQIVNPILYRLFFKRIMRPNALHAVYTPENAICHGGHFFASATLKDTFSGIVHTFMADEYITNNSPKHSKQALRRIIIFYHYALTRQMIEVDGTCLEPHLIDLLFTIFFIWL